jgi:hypothetical protein
VRLPLDYHNPNTEPGFGQITNIRFTFIMMEVAPPLVDTDLYVASNTGGGAQLPPAVCAPCHSGSSSANRTKENAPKLVYHNIHGQSCMKLSSSNESLSSAGRSFALKAIARWRHALLSELRSSLEYKTDSLRLARADWPSPPGRLSAIVTSSSSMVLSPRQHPYHLW